MPPIKRIEAVSVFIIYVIILLEEHSTVILWIVKRIQVKLGIEIVSVQSPILSLGNTIPDTFRCAFM